MIRYSATENKWNTPIETERNFWYANIIKIEINIPDTCSNCQLSKIYLANGDTILNPLIGRCSNCKKNIT